MKEQKTNVMRVLDQKKIPYRANFYLCDEFIDAIHIADLLGQPYACTYKTLVSIGKSGRFYVFVIPIAEELDLKAAARSVQEKSIELLHVKELQKQKPVLQKQRELLRQKPVLQKQRELLRQKLE